MHVSPNTRSAAGRALSATEVEDLFPHVASIIKRGAWTIGERFIFNEKLAGLGPHRANEFNGILRCRFDDARSAASLADCVQHHRLHRLMPNSTHGATEEEVAVEWERLEAEREEILAWGRATKITMDVVQRYRFERRQGAYSLPAHVAAATVIKEAHPTVPNPMNYAGVFIEWAEKEHRSWFWRCCRHQVL